MYSLTWIGHTILAIDSDTCVKYTAILTTLNSMDSDSDVTY